MSRRNSVRHAKCNGRQSKARERWNFAFGVAGTLATLFSVIAISTQRPLISDALAQDVAAKGDAGGHVHNALREAPETLYDGSVRPQDIPDEVAISILMNSLRPSGPEETALTQLQAKVRRVDLSENDFAILVSELVDFDVAAKAQEARVEEVRPSSFPGIGAASARVLEDRFVEEQRARGALAEDRYQQLLESLSPDGRTRLEAHLLHVKTRIRIYPPADMSKQTL